MSRYIDADCIDWRLIIPTNPTTAEENMIYRARKLVESQPKVDVVEVVRCKNCKHFHDGIYNGEYWMECDEYKIALSSDDWFCADGKRRER